MACFVELKFKDETTGGEKAFLLPVIDKDINLSIDDIVTLVNESDNEELKSFLPQLKVKYNTKDAIMERGKIQVNSISSIDSNIDANSIKWNLNDGPVKKLLEYSITNLNIGKNIHMANAELVNSNGETCEGVLFKQGSMRKIQIDTGTNVTPDSFSSIVSSDKFQKVLAHELVHYIADDKLESISPESIEYMTIASIYDTFKQNYQKKDSDLNSDINKVITEVDSYEGVKKLQEFLANAIGDSRIRNEMMNMKPLVRTEENKSLLDSFVNWLSKLVFGESIEPSLMSDLLSVTSGVIHVELKENENIKEGQNSQSNIKQRQNIVLNEEQNNVVNKAIDFIKTGNSDEFFTIEGKAGTGKTTIAERIVSEFPKKRVYVAALSHKAKSVIREKFVENGVRANFYSLAGLLGQKLDLETGVFSRDEKDKTVIPLERADIVLIDESSMINEQALDLIFEFKKKNAKIIFLGDIGQLPPIRTLSNPYYKGKEHLLEKKSPTFTTPNKGLLLTRVRQGEASPILPFADLFWKNSQKEHPASNPASINDRSNIVTNNGALLFSNSFSKIKDSVLESFKKAVESNAPNHIKVVTYKNDIRKDINKFVHESIFGLNSPEFNNGELLIFNDSYESDDEPIENSTEIQVKNIRDRYVDSDDLIITTLEFLLNGNLKLIPVVNSDSKQKYKDLISKKFAEAFALKGKDRRAYLMALQEAWSFKNKYANVDYAYAITSHKSQGSTYDIVVVDEKDINSVSPISAKTKSESIYTALTRARNVSIVISSLKVDDVDINVEELNSSIKKAKSEGVENFPTSQPQHISADDIDKGIELYNKAQKEAGGNQLQIPFSKTTDVFKKSAADNVSELSYMADLLGSTYGINMHLMTSKEIAKQFDTPDAAFSIHRAFILNNEVYINTDKASTAEPLHEMAHLVLTALKFTDYNLYEVLTRSIQTHPTYNDIAKAYKELQGVDLDEEVFATIFGEFYRGVARNKKEVEWNINNKGLFDRIIANIKGFFERLFGVNIDVSDEDFIGMPLDEVMTKFGDMMMSSRFAGVNEGILMSNELEGLKKKLSKDGLLVQMC